MRNFKSAQYAILVPVFVFLICLSFTIGVWYLINNAVKQQVALQFQNDADQMTSLIQEKVTVYTEVVFGMQGLFAASQGVEKNEWEAYVKRLDLPKNYAGISAVSYIQRVNKFQLINYPYAIYPESNKDEYYPVTYSISTTNSPTTVGFDVSSEPIRNISLVEAGDNDKVVATGIFKGITTGAPTFSIYAPIYANSKKSATILERREALTGYVSVGFRLEHLFNEIMNNAVYKKNIKVEVYDTAELNADSANKVLFNSSTGTLMALANDNQSLTHVSNVAVGGRMWTVYFKELPGYRSSFGSQYGAFALLAFGLVLSILLGWLIFSYSRSRARAIIFAQGMTKDLSESRTALQEYIDQMSTFNVKVDLDGKFLLANKAAMSVEGMSKEEFYKTNFFEGPWWGSDPAVLKRVRAAFAQAALGQPVVYDEELTIAGNKKIFINFGLVPIKDSSGKVVSIVAEGRDISVLKAAEETLKARTADLERINKIMIDRELKMIELKNENKKLKASLEKI